MSFKQSVNKVLPVLAVYFTHAAARIYDERQARAFAIAARSAAENIWRVACNGIGRKLPGVTV